VAAALEVFSEAGYHKGSIRDVADRVGLSQAGLLHHYPSKHRLLEAVLDWRDQDALARMGAEPPQGVAMLRALVDLAAHNETTPQVVELHVTLSAEATAPHHPVHDYFVRRYAAVLEMVTDAFEHAAASGELRPGVDCHSAARTLVALMDGLQGLWLLDRESVDMAEEVRRYLRPMITVDLEGPPSSREVGTDREHAATPRTRATHDDLVAALPAQGTTPPRPCARSAATPRPTGTPCATPADG
jgi:AcrR family transcriptional regulator